MSEKQKLLIVDDSELNRDILKEILGSSYDYLEAENGTQAIQILEVHPEIDLMLLDINMQKNLSKLCEKRMIWGSQTISAGRLMQLS